MCVGFVCVLNVWASVRDSAFIVGRRLFETAFNRTQPSEPAVFFTGQCLFETRHLLEVLRYKFFFLKTFKNRDFRLVVTADNCCLSV